MTVNERIAKAVGWKEGKSTGVIQRIFTHPKFGTVTPRCLPDFDSSLDAMAIAEATLTDDQTHDLWFEIAKIVGAKSDSSGHFDSDAGILILRATAQQRAAAFLAVIEP